MNDERALIVRAVGGERLALDQLASAHRPTVLRIARHILGDPAMAEDATQDVFVRLQLALPGFRGDAELGTWLYRITLNICRDHLRRQRSRKWAAPSRSDDETGETERVASGLDPDPAASLDAERARRFVRAAIARLPDDQREAVLLRYVSDLSYAEIAQITSTPPGTVASRIYRALRKLGEDLLPRHLELIK